MAKDGFIVWDAAKPEEYRQWVEAWLRWPKREVFAHPDYLLASSHPGTRALCSAWQSAEGCVLFPFFVRSLSNEKFIPAGVSSACDLTSPYGYGGAFVWNATDRPGLTAAFWRAHEAWARGVGAVSEFVRFALDDSSLLPYPAERLHASDNVRCDLTRPEADIWASFEHKVRKNVNKARRSGVVVEFDENGRRLDDFLKIYFATMDRRGAGKSYYFSKDYFQRLLCSLPGHAVFFHSLRDGRVVSTELVLVSEENIYSFLGGTDEASFDLRPNDILKYEIILWGKRQGKKMFVIGGGYAPDDGIFRYKKGFAPYGCVPFFVGRRVFAPDVYDQLVQARGASSQNGVPWSPQPGFFPAYRAPTAQ